MLLLLTACAVGWTALVFISSNRTVAGLWWRRQSSADSCNSARSSPLPTMHCPITAPDLRGGGQTGHLPRGHQSTTHLNPALSRKAAVQPCCCPSCLRHFVHVLLNHLFISLHLQHNTAWHRKVDQLPLWVKKMPSQYSVPLQWNSFSQFVQRLIIRNLILIGSRNYCDVSVRLVLLLLISWLTDDYNYGLIQAVNPVKWKCCCFAWHSRSHC